MFLHEVKSRGAIVAVVNGKISDRTTARFQRFGIIGRWLYSFIDVFCVQNQTFYDRFLALGVPQQRLHVTGSTKADVSFPLLTSSEKALFRSDLGLKEHERLIILASTHSPEEEELLGRLFPLFHAYSDIKIAIVPRHPERFSEVFRCTKEKDLSAVLLSMYDGVSPWNIMVVDRLGVLTKIYQLATLAIVCGSFTDRIGGHNILEPAAVGIPVLVGPHMQSQPTLYHSAKAANAITQVSYDTVADIVEQFLTNEKLRECASAEAFHWAESLRGATGRTIKILVEEVEKNRFR
jgi:3-deoxy-D-manno-octulosonic-acid transferase